MLDSIPLRAFAQFEIPIAHRASPPLIDGDLREWGPPYLLPPLVEIENESAIADVYAAWNDDGLYFAFDVPERKTPLKCDPVKWFQQDGLRICIDTRDARDIKRHALCHFFYVLPVGGGADKRRPVVGLHKMSHAKEPPPPVDVELVDVAARVGKSGYAVEVAIPAACLNGWDPAEHTRLGLFYKVQDVALGSQHLTVSDVGWNADPSTWATAVLTRGKP